MKKSFYATELIFMGWSILADAKEKLPKSEVFE